MKGTKGTIARRSLGMKKSGLTNERAELTITMLLADTRVCEMRRITWILLQVVDAYFLSTVAVLSPPAPGLAPGTERCKHY